MNAIRKIACISLFALCASAGLFAFDLGLELSNGAGYRDTGKADWFTDHKAILWLTFPFDAKNANSLSIEGAAYAAKPAGSSDFKFYADLSMFRLSLVPVQTGKTRLALDAGRFATADITGCILNQTVDGAEFHLSSGFGNIDLLAGYTGLLNIRKTNSLMTADDYADANTDAVYGFGASRAIGKISLQLAQLVGKTDLVIEGVGQYDLRRYVDSSYGETIDTAYGTLSLNGPILGTLYYTLSGTYQAGIFDSGTKGSLNSVLAKARLDLYPAKGNHFFAEFLYNPPKTDFFSTTMPITFQSAGALYPLGYGYLMLASAGWNLNPVRALNFNLGGKAFLYPEPQSGNTSMYQGTEITAGATVRATSDLRFRLDSACYLPNGNDLQYQASLKAILDL